MFGFRFISATCDFNQYFTLRCDFIGGLWCIAEIPWENQIHLGRYIPGLTAHPSGSAGVSMRSGTDLGPGPFYNLQGGLGTSWSWVYRNVIYNVISTKFFIMYGIHVPTCTTGELKEMLSNNAMSTYSSEEAFLSMARGNQDSSRSCSSLTALSSTWKCNYN